MKKKDMYRITRRLYRELRSSLKSDLTLKKIKGEKKFEVHGLYYWEGKMVLDYRYPIIPTLIHEYLHKWYPEKSESWIENKEKDIIRSLSPIQARNIIKEFAKAISN